MKINPALAVGAFAAMIWAAPTWAADSGWSVGADVGQSRFDLSPVDGFFAADPGRILSHDDTDTAYRLSAGYEINRFLGVEANYADLGQARTDSLLTVPAPDRPTDEEIIVDAKGWGVNLDGRYPFTEQWSAYGRIGAFDGRVRLRLLVDGGFVLGNGTDVSATKWTSTYGVGVDWAFTSQWTARLGWDRYHDLGNDDTGKYDVDLLSVGIVYRFF